MLSYTFVKNESTRPFFHPSILEKEKIITTLTCRSLFDNVDYYILI